MRIVEERVIDGAMHDMNLPPLLVGQPPTNLRGAIVANSHDEERINNLRRQAEGLRSIELVRAVDGEAIGRAAQAPREASDGCGVRPEMNMHMTDPCALRDPQ